MKEEEISKERERKERRKGRKLGNTEKQATENWT